MNFRKKLNTRLYFFIGYTILGIVMISISFILKADDSFLSSFGFALFVVGIARIKRHFTIIKSEESIKKQEIKENDERNIAIANKSKSYAFSVYAFLSGIAIIVFEILGFSDYVMVISVSLCILLLLYYISYLIIRKRL